MCFEFEFFEFEHTYITLCFLLTTLCCLAFSINHHLLSIRLIRSRRFGLMSLTLLRSLSHSLPINLKKNGPHSLELPILRCTSWPGETHWEVLSELFQEFGWVWVEWWRVQNWPRCWHDYFYLSNVSYCCWSVQSYSFSRSSWWGGQLINFVVWFGSCTYCISFWRKSWDYGNWDKPSRLIWLDWWFC